MAIHIFDTSGEAYDACQCDENINQGDLLYIPSEGIVGLADTWPIAITKECGAFHLASAAVLLKGDAAILATLKYLTDAHLAERRRRLAIINVCGDPLIIKYPGEGKVIIADRYGDPLDTFTLVEFDEILIAGFETDGTLRINW